jgi:hypothetical protein
MDPLHFRSPPAGYRSAPFWSWNDQLQVDRLNEQIEGFHQAGHGGFFMHARRGLRTAYLSKAWFAAIAESVATAARLGLDAWLYDENDWPSGSAGGRVASEHRRYRARALVCSVHDESVPIDEALLRITCALDGKTISDAIPWRHGDAVGAGRRFVQCTPWIAPLGDRPLHGATFIDTLHPPAVQAFLRHTHHRYEEHLGAEFGTVVPGVFTDEPSFGFGRAIKSELWTSAVPWTDDLPTSFLSEHGYDITPHLVSLFFDTHEAAAVRHDYWHTVARRLTDSWSRQIFEWCDQRHLKLVGHHNGEDSLVEQMRWTGGVMPNYRYYHMPGIDTLGRDTGEPLDGWSADGNVVGLKQLDSVACQLGKERTLCEAFGAAGQDFALRGRWWLTNWLAVLGVNFLTPHLASYSLRGARKRDYPPTLSSHQPWWPHQRTYEDAAARVCYALSHGRRIVDVLVIHPMNSARIAYTPGDASDVAKLDRMLIRLASGLLAMHCDFHFGDESLLAEFAAIADGELVMGSQRYRTVVIPRLGTVARTTVELLGDFAEAGGHVVCVGAAPTRIDGRLTSQPTLPRSTIYVDDEFGDEEMADVASDPADRNRDDHSTPGPIPMPLRLREVLEHVTTPRLSIIGDGTDRVWYHLRALDDGREVLFVANISEERDVDATLRWPGTGRLERWDAIDGTVSAFAVDGHDTVRVRLDRMSHALLVRDPALPALDIAVGDARSAPTVQTLRLDRSWTIEPVGPNTLVIDSCSIRLPGDRWRDISHLPDATARIRSAGVDVPFAVRFEFDADGSPTWCDAVIEGDRWAVELNGADLAPPTGWWLDPSWRRYPITEGLKQGRNTVTIAGTSGTDADLEPVILLGEFSVPARFTGQRTHSRGTTFERWQVERRIRGASRPQGSAEALIGNGLPHFVGTVRLTQTFDIPPDITATSAVLRVDDIDAATALVAINGVRAGQLSWRPFTLEVGELLIPGRNEITISLVTSLRNLLGPFHTERGDPTFVSPATFDENVTDDCWLVPLGVGDVFLDIAVSTDSACT